MSHEEYVNPHFTKKKLVVIIEASVPVGWDKMTSEQKKLYLSRLQEKFYSFLRVFDIDLRGKEVI